MSLIQTVKATGRFGDYSKLLLERVLEMAKYMYFIRADAVFDVYHADSIRSAERIRRSDQTMCSLKIRHDDVPIPKNFKSFLSNIDNKNELVRYLGGSWSEQMMRERVFPLAQRYFSALLMSGNLRRLGLLE